MFIEPRKKIVTDPHLLREYIDDLQVMKNARHFKIGYLGGFFDLFHSGHMLFIRKAKEHCDFLIVSVNTDEQARHKGPDRPIMPQESRGLAVAHMPHVDAVLLAKAEQNPHTKRYFTSPQSYLPLKADIAFFGKDGGVVTEQNIPEHRRNFGKEIMLIDAEVGFHTTDIVNRIRTPYPQP